MIENLPIFIEDVYNRKRVHSGIGYLTPEALEKAVQQQPEMASRFELTLFTKVFLQQKGRISSHQSQMQLVFESGTSQIRDFDYSQKVENF